MKKRVLKIVILMIGFLLFSIQVWATTENVVSPEITAENTPTKTEEQPPEELPKVEEKPTETKKNQTMYVQERCNIRASYSVESDRVGGLDVGTEVTVIAEYSNGWYKIKNGDGEAYIKAGILRSTPPKIEEPEEEPEQVPEEAPEENSSEQPTSDQLPETENKDEVDNEYAELINEIGVLPEVGHNLADILHAAAIILGIAFVIYVKYKS